MEQIINTIVNNSTAVGLLIYFIYKDNKFNDTINNALTSISSSIEVIKDLLIKEGEK